MDLQARRLRAFKANKRAFWALVVFVVLFVLSLGAELWVNDKPLFIYKGHKAYFPIFKDYPETAFGGDFYTSADYTDPYVKNHLLKNAFVIWPLIPYSYDTIIMDLKTPAPTPPSLKHWLGTDDQARDVLARLVYGYRISILFGLILSVFSVGLGVAIGALQGYYGGLIDLLGQRFLEIWSAIPMLFLLIILSNLFTPNFWWLLGLVLAFSWMGLAQVVRTEFLRGRNMDYVKASYALGVSDARVIFYHILPNALVATITYLPFVMAGSIGTLVSLDFLGFGMPVGSASLGELLNQGKNNLYAPHLALVGFFATALLLSILVFIGEGVRDAFSATSVK
ncbi:ABC transporter permease [Helicobacter ailurogastricus]|uniref:Oligopeptide transport system permease protein OppC (TC 3.A.1.5.1) n=3 Tax=Helicobacter ailurogastricus TaxID=1578720 RepID=A0A0K2X7X6_9HELI|nr:ABC transporter permease [Helicobacter ailurogastricus]CRF41698.1 Oligopeptide transport system permease protein OppC (TC 3.A.1.5.1) [Helicobacter ailurogastricus]CRF44425.1 Oligopeptide transport system permease protein OppC (TC 3.A.1.5.1) [Helicobacter ailurogastricus]